MLHQKPQTNALSNGSPFANVHPPSVGREIGDLLRQSFFAAPPETLRELSDLLSTAAAAKCDGGDPEEVSGRRTSGAGTVGPGSGAPSAVAAAAVASMIDHLIHYRLGGSSDSYNNIRAAAVAAVPGSSYPTVCCCTYPSSSNAGGAHRQSIKSVRGYVRCSERRIPIGASDCRAVYWSFATLGVTFVHFKSSEEQLLIVSIVV